MKLFTLQTAAAQVRRQMYQGREHLVVPVVALVEGVVHGELALAEEFGHFVSAWNGRPVVIYHPTRRGVPISANEPEVLERQAVGHVFNAHIDGPKLKAEMWLDIAKAQEIGGRAWEAVQTLERGEPMEVSTGYFADTEPGEGIFGNARYSGIQRNIKPDHLALLPGGEGECNWADGCGAPRVASRKDGDAVKKSGKKTTLGQRIKTLMSELLRTQQEGVSHSDTRDLLESALREVFDDPMDFFIIDVFDDAVVYDQPGEGLFRRTYQVDENQQVTLGEPEQVVRRTTYEPVTNAGATSPRNHKEGPTHTMDEKKQIIDGLIANEANTLTDADRQWLNEMDVTWLKKFATPKANAGAPAAESTPKANGCTCGGAKANEGAAAPKAPSGAAEPPKTLTAEEIEQIVVNRLDAKEKGEIVERLKANADCPFGEDRLKALSLDELKKLEHALKPAYYGGIPLPKMNQSTDDGPPAPPPVVLAAPAKKEDGK